MEDIDDLEDFKDEENEIETSETEILEKENEDHTFSTMYAGMALGLAEELSYDCIDNSDKRTTKITAVSLKSATFKQSSPTYFKKFYDHINGAIDYGDI